VSILDSLAYLSLLLDAPALPLGASAATRGLVSMPKLILSTLLANVFPLSLVVEGTVVGLGLGRSLVLNGGLGGG
jgi:hypothetical protein